MTVFSVFLTFSIYICVSVTHVEGEYVTYRTLHTFDTCIQMYEYLKPKHVQKLLNLLLKGEIYDERNVLTRQATLMEFCFHAPL